MNWPPEWPHWRKHVTNLERRISALEQASTSAEPIMVVLVGMGCPIERVQAGGQVWVRASGEGDASFLERVAAEAGPVLAVAGP